MTRFKTDIDKIYIVIPARNEDRYIGSLLHQLSNLGFKKIVVVDDQSNDDTLMEAKQYREVQVLEHVVNLGAGAATQTGISFAFKEGAELICTIDADLQHDPKDLIDLIHHIEDSNVGLVIGSRFLKVNSIPTSRIVYNRLANIISWSLTGVSLSDSQSGLKCFNRELASHLDLNYDGFEFCMEMIKEANQNKIKISEIPVNVYYTKETTEKGQNLLSGLKILGRILSPH